MLKTYYKALRLIPRGDWPRFLGLTVLSILTALLEMFSAGIIFVALSVVTQGAEAVASMPFGVGKYFSGLAGDNLAFVTLGLACVLTIFRIVAQFSFAVMVENLRRHILLKITTTLFHGYINSSYRELSAIPPGNLLNKVTIAPMNAISQCTFGAIEMVNSIFLIGLFSGLLMLVQLPTTVAVIGAMSILVAIYWRIFYRRVGDWGKRLVAVFGTLYQNTRAATQSIKTIKVMQAEPIFFDRFSRQMEEQVEVQTKIAKLNQMPRLILEFFLFGGIFLFLLSSIATQESLVAVVPTVALFGIAAVRLIPAFSRFITAVQNFRNKEAFLDEFYDDYMRFSEAGSSSSDKRERGEAKGKLGSIELKNVEYAYQSGSELVLDGLSMTIQGGDFIGLAGLSGAGKTTVADIILNLIEPRQGNILIDGQPRIPGQYDAADANLFSYVPQDAVLLNDTLRSNIAFGAIDTKIDETRVWEAIEQSALTGLVKSLPNGLDTILGEGQRELSGGERQRVAIARALYTRAPVLVLDEPTSSLDGSTEASIVSMLIDLKRAGKTIIIIAHRLNSLQACDCIYFFGKGRILAKGRFDDLVRTSAEFRHLTEAMKLTEITADPAAASSMSA